jgi:hypothetical protein
MTVARVCRERLPDRPTMADPDFTAWIAFYDGYFYRSDGEDDNRIKITPRRNKICR